VCRGSAMVFTLLCRLPFILPHMAAVPAKATKTIMTPHGRLAFAVDYVGVVHVDQAWPQVVPPAPAAVGRVSHNETASGDGW